MREIFNTEFISNIQYAAGVSAPSSAAPAKSPAFPTTAADDLLQLQGNPFANMLNGTGNFLNLISKNFNVLFFVGHTINCPFDLRLVLLL